MTDPSPHDRTGRPDAAGGAAEAGPRPHPAEGAVALPAATPDGGATEPGCGDEGSGTVGEGGRATSVSPEVQGASPPRLLATAADTAGRLALVELRERRGAGPPRHLHQREDEIVYVLEGELVVELDGERRPAPAGSCLVLPTGREHAYAVASDEARLLVIAAPAGLEGLYRELGGLSASGPVGVERLVAVAARYGVAITGPPLSADDRGAEPPSVVASTKG